MKAQRGFTLLELLIGMALLGLILALLFGGFRLASNSWDAVEQRIERTNNEQLGRALTRRLLTQMQPVRWRKAPNLPIAFVGERNALRTLAPVTGQSGAGGLRVIELKGEDDDAADKGKGRRRLVLRHAPVRYDAPIFSEGIDAAKSYVILDDLDTVEFSYFGPPKQGTAPVWQDAWANTERLPQLVRLRLGSREKGWAEMVVAPMIGGTGCRWDNFYKRCA